MSSCKAENAFKAFGKGFDHSNFYAIFSIFFDSSVLLQCLGRMHIRACI